MSRFALAIVGSLMLLGTAHAQVPNWTSWYGDAVIENADPSCSSAGGATNGSFVGVTLSPANIGANGTDSYFAVFLNRSGFSMKVVGADLASGQPYAARAVSGSGNRFGFNGTIESYVQAPAILTTGTTYVRVTIRVTNYFNVASCTLTLRTYMVKRSSPDQGTLEE